MTDDQAKAEVARLLLERAEMKRLGTDLSPDKLMLLKRLMYRLGMNNVKLARKPKRNSLLVQSEQAIRKSINIFPHTMHWMTDLRNASEEPIQHDRIAVIHQILKRDHETHGRSWPVGSPTHRQHMEAANLHDAAMNAHVEEGLSREMDKGAMDMDTRPNEMMPEDYHMARRRETLLRLARRIGVKRYGRVTPETMFKIVGHAMDNPDLDAFHAAADEIDQNHPGEPSVEAFRKWLNGEDWADSGLLRSISPRDAGNIYSMVGPPVNAVEEHDLAHEIRPIGGGGQTASAVAFDQKTPMPLFGRNRGQDHWHPRKWAGTRYSLHTRPDLRTKKRVYTSEEVARVVHAKDGAKGLIHMMVGAHHWHPKKNYDENGQVIPREGRPTARESRRRDLLRRLARQSKMEGMRRYELNIPEEQNLFPEERDILIGATPTKQKQFTSLVSQGVKNKSGNMPGLSEIKALAEVGSPAKGGYQEMNEFVNHLVKSPHDANRWVLANAVLSPQTPWEQHTAGAVEALAVWHSAGRPTDAKSLDNLFGKTIRNERGTLQLDRRFPKAYKGPDLYSGYKAEQLKRIFGSDVGEPGQGVGFGDFGGGDGLKVPNFGMAFVDSRGVPVDTHMAKLLSNVDDGFSRKLVEKIVRGEHPDKAIGTALLESQKRLAGTSHNWPYAMAYKTLISKAASDLGWEPRQVQEAVWTAVIGIMVAKHLGAGPKSHEILSTLNQKALRSGWSLGAITSRPEVLRDLDRLGISSKRVRNAIDTATARHDATSRTSRSVHTSDPSALESAAARLKGEVPSAGRNILASLLRKRRKVLP